MEREKREEILMNRVAAILTIIKVLKCHFQIINLFDMLIRGHGKKRNFQWVNNKS
jgi:hypothetical protein